jgi:hypothetical protein
VKAVCRETIGTISLTLLLAMPAWTQVRIEPLTPRLSPAPVVSVSAFSLPTIAASPSLAVSAPAPTILAAPAAAPIPLAAAAAAPVAVPAAAPVAAAAADGPARSARDELSSAGKAAVPNEAGAYSLRSINSFWDGLGAAASEVDVPLVVAPPAGLRLEAAGASSDSSADLPAWLSLSDKKHAAALSAAVKLARSTRAGRRALDAAAKALEAEGRVMTVDVKDLGRNYGEYDFLTDRLRLDKKMFLPGREVELAGTLAHELTHVVQHATGLFPSNALELEIEAHLLDLELMDELGVKPPANTFARQAQEALAKSPAAFIELMQAAVPGSPFLGESSFADMADQLEQDRDDMARKKSARARQLVDVIDNDLRLIRSKRGRAAYRAFSERVLAELSRRSAAAAAAKR